MRTVAAPTPREPPVISATLPDSERCMRCSLRSEPRKMQAVRERCLCKDVARAPSPATAGTSSTLKPSRRPQRSQIPQPRWLKHLKPLLRNLHILPLNLSQRTRVLAPIRSRKVFMPHFRAFHPLGFNQPMNLVLIHRHKIRIIRPQIHSRIGVVNGKPKRPRQLGKGADIVRILQKAGERLLEVVV